MSDVIIDRDGPVLLVGGGPVDPERLKRDAARSSAIVGADGGAVACLSAGLMPDAVIGDMDSLPEAIRARIPAKRVHEIAEQDSTDFDKCLRSIRAPLVLGHGFLGARFDHALAAMTVLARRSFQRCMLIGPEDAVALLPPRISLDLPPGTRVSLYPLGPVGGRSGGLRWPVDGLAFSPADTVGTSNEATGPVTLDVDAPRMLVIVPVAEAGRLETGLNDAKSWPRDGRDR
ncbi:thiamine pyrophosphokinase [Roseivivax halodurans JCM 10272]|uniref:Thiamine diphosphokinase n=1 Tax=Roseivivax halodurans JCM 10272 TaxID=1449350 RepID=X7EJZ4_9RHOB|nr:thiamine diphosphokinase [Roseivivax halodurans]ETX15458.1 thiamine pyrophosphokinase [Roseivivax halodurans JCM 10272]